MRALLAAPAAAVLVSACASAPVKPAAAASAAPAAASAAPVPAPGAAATAPVLAPGDEWFMTAAGTAGDLRVSVGGAGGVPVLFLHGLGADLEVWRAQLDHLRVRGVRAIAFDQRGHGGSDRPRDDVYSIDALVDDLEAVAKALSLKRFVLVGHSMSGAVLSAWAGRHPDAVAGLVYVDAVGAFDAVPRGAIREMIATDAARGPAEVRAAYEEMLGDKARPATRERVLATAASLDPRAFASLRRSMVEADSRAAHARYHGPAVAIESGGSPPPFSASAALGVRRVTIADVSHWLMLDAPAETSAAIDAFLATLTGR